MGSIEDRTTRAAELLRHNIESEIHTMDGLLGLGLDDATVQRLADAVSAEVLYAFAIDWSPDWLQPGAVHAWERDGSFHARCGRCLSDSPPMRDRESAEEWALQHEGSHPPA